MTPSGPEGASSLPDAKGPAPARTYDAWFGGKDNLGVDREHIEKNLEVMPEAAERVLAQREFLERAVRFLVGEAGIRQILDIGCGLPAPTRDNVHEIAQGIEPDTRVVYVDSNPVAVAHMEALQTDGARTVAFTGDVREPEAIVTHPDARAALDLDQPVGVLLVGILHFISDEDDPPGFVARLRDAIA